MNNGFTKLYNQIITSSIWSEDDKVRIMWITILASADPTGYVSGSIPGMAAIARMDLQDAERSIRILSSPDQYSRSKEHEGRRLDEVDGGWLILNYAKYRAKRDPEKRRQQNREAQARYRRKPIVSKNKPEVSRDKPKAEDRRQKTEDRVRTCSKFREPTAQEVEEYARSIDYTLNGEKFVSHYDANGWIRGKTKMRDWRAAVRYWKTTENEKNGYGSGKIRDAEPVGEFIR